MPGNIANVTPADIAKWPRPNYVDPERRAWMPEYASILYAAATLMAGTRLWLRSRKYSGGLGLDDAALIISWLCLTLFTTLALIGTETYHMDRHTWDVPYSNFVPMAKVSWIGEMAFLLTSCFVKLSVLLFYRRLVDGICSRFWLGAVLFAIGITCSYTVAFCLALVFNCTPTEAYWEAFDFSYKVHYRCADTTAINLLAGSMAIASDLYAVLLPCIMLRNMKLPGVQKAALNVVFCLGLVVVGASCVRTYYLYETGHTSDVTSAIFDVFVYSQLELCLGMMCASAPALRVLFREYLSEPLSRIRHTVSSSANHKSRAHDSEMIEQVVIWRMPREGAMVERQDFSARYTAPAPAPATASPVAFVAEGRAAGPRGAAAAVAAADDDDEVEKDAVREQAVERVMTPADYEEYNLQSMERYRKWSRIRMRSVDEGRAPEVAQGRSWLDLDAGRAW